MFRKPKLNKQSKLNSSEIKASQSEAKAEADPNGSNQESIITNSHDNPQNNKIEIEDKNQENIINNIKAIDNPESLNELKNTNFYCVNNDNIDVTDEINLQLNENTKNIILENNAITSIDSNILDKISKIKSEINKKNEKKKMRGTAIKPLELVMTSYYKEEEADRGIKKIFIAENDFNKTMTNEDYKKLVGVKKEEIDLEKENKRKKIIEHQKDLFTLPQDLRVTQQTQNDYVENLIRLSAAGLIEVPLSLENKLKNIEETEVMKKQIIDKKLADELDYLKVLKKLGPSYARGYKSDLSHKKLTKLNNVFENVFVNLNGRKRKLLKEKMTLDNRSLESWHVNSIEKKSKNNNTSETTIHSIANNSINEAEIDNIAKKAYVSDEEVNIEDKVK